MDLDPKSNPARAIAGNNAVDVRYTHNSWASVMLEHQSALGNQPWLTYVDFDGTTTLSYTEFVDHSRRIASMLCARGVGKGDRVLIAGHNHPDTIAQYFACWFIGACAVPINMTEDDGRIDYILNASGAKLIFVRNDYVSRLDAMVPDGIATIVVDSDSTTSRYITEVLSMPPAPAPDEEDMRFVDCMMVYTSGTTGNPKGVVLIQQNLLADGLAIADWNGIDEGTCMMCVLPVHHVNGTIVTHVTPFLARARVVLCRKFSASRFFPIIREHGVHIVSVVPTLLALLIETRSSASPIDTGVIRHFICGAGPLTVELGAAFEDSFNIRVVHGYGLSETTCYSCFLPVSQDQPTHRSLMRDFGFPSIGVAIPPNEMDIHDPNGKSLPAGERGEIVIRGTTVMRGYDANDKANADAFQHGWFRSGDEGFIVEDSTGQRFFFITGRLKELIIRGGVNIAPLEIDEVLSAAPGVRAGICVGFEHVLYGEEVGALVVPYDDTASQAAILEHCRQQLPFPKRPKVVLFTDALPVTSTGKYQRNKVKHLFHEYRNERFRK